MPLSFPILAKDNLLKAAGDVTSRFEGSKRGETQRELFASIAEPLAEAAVAKGMPQLVADFYTEKDGKRDGVMTSVKTKGQVFTFHQKMISGVLELRCYPPIPAGDFKLRKLEEGGVGKLYGEKSSGDVPRITLDVGARVRVYMNGKSQESLDGEWGRGVSEVALALIDRARKGAARDADEVVEIEPGVTQTVAAKKKVADVLVDAKPRVEQRAIPGHDLLGAQSWRGSPVLVTQDRGGDKNVHVLLERTDNSGKTVLWPLKTPDDADFPKKGCAIVLDGDTLHLFGGVNGEGKVSNAHWSIDLAKANKDPGASLFKQGAPLKDASAWAAVAMGERDAFVVGGVAGYFMRRTGSDDGKGADEKVQQNRRGMQVGGFPQWRDRSAPPADPTGASTLVEKGAIFVGPGTAKDGLVSAYDTSEQAWFALPALPIAVGMGQLLKSGSELVYSGGFLKDGKPSTEIFTLNTDDPFAGWQKKGESDAVAGAARVVERNGKKVSFLVAPQGALMAHLE